MCRVLNVARSGFYAAQTRSKSARAQADDALLREIRVVHLESRGSYGSPRVHRELRERGLRVARKRVARLMKRHGIRGKAARRRRPRVAAVAQTTHVADHVQRRFHCPELDRIWVADLTYIGTPQGWVYLAVILDLCSRRVVGWHLSRAADFRVTLRALEMALAQRRLARGAIHHSDRGIHYSCAAYQERLEQVGLQPSFSRVGQCWDNAVAESFFRTLKTECVPPGGYGSYDEARRALFDYIEVWYNRKRRHSTLGYLSPAEYEYRL